MKMEKKMHKYEAMIIIRPELAEEEKKNLFNQITEAVTKLGGKIAAAAVWAEKRKLCFPIKKAQEGTYYLMNFQMPPLAIKDLRHAYKLNENIMRVLISVLE